MEREGPEGISIPDMLHVIDGLTNWTEGIENYRHNKYLNSVNHVIWFDDVNMFTIQADSPILNDFELFEQDVL